MYLQVPEGGVDSQLWAGATRADEADRQAGGGAPEGVGAGEGGDSVPTQHPREGKLHAEVHTWTETQGGLRLDLSISGCLYIIL